jgi:helicase
MAHLSAASSDRTAPLPRPIYWLKTTDPQADIAGVGPEIDSRVLVPDDESFRTLRTRLEQRGAEVRAVKYWLERETITDVAPGGGIGALTVYTEAVRAGGEGRDRRAHREGGPAAVARDAFDALWQAQDARGRPSTEQVPVGELVPASWVPYLPYPSFNPAQAEAAPLVLEGAEHLLVVAPTGAGKTTIGMLAALRAILGEGRKAAWLVPQRSLTDELDRELQDWRRRGLRVERLSGEYSVDAQRVREADLWVTTTEKFEVLCRTASLRPALAEVGTLIVDEVHLLGDPERGPVLEAVLARLRDEESRMRMVGLSATVSNAEQVADWLGARLVRIAWRPSRLTWQLPTIPVLADWSVASAARTRMTNGIVDAVTSDHGSVLVFCGSKHGVRSTALAIAANRGVRTTGVRPDDLEALRAVCDTAGVGLHYKDWEYKRQAEQDFRERRTDVLVATSTVAAGVNLPARAVVVRDTRIGQRDVDVATVQQMFGRAGRLGAGESSGWAFMIVDEAERAAWQQRLIGGYTVDSQISSSLPDQVLAEAVQGRIRTIADAERWWLGTFAHHQGSHSTDALHRALNFLSGAGYCATHEEDGRTHVTPTELGTLTARVMISTYTGYQLREALARSALPADADQAEEVMIELVCTLVPKLARAPLSEHLKPAVAALLYATGRLTPSTAGGEPSPSSAEFHPPYTPGDLSRAALLTVARSAWAFAEASRQIGGVPYSSLRPALDDAPRYLHWIGSQGQLGTLHPWAAVVAADLSRRVRWRRCGAPRGAGRLLWMCEQMATPAHAERLVPAMWAAARDRGLVSPDWPTLTPPGGNRLDGPSYGSLLHERVAEDELPPEPSASTRPLAGRVLVTWNGTAYQARYSRDEPSPATADEPGTTGAEPAGKGVAVFSWRGDHRATGWLAAYSGIADACEPSPAKIAGSP